MQRNFWTAALGVVTAVTVLVAAPDADATQPTVTDTTAPAATAPPTTVAAAIDPPPPDVTPPVVGVTRSSAYISPNGDGRLDRLTLRVTVDEPVTLSVLVHNPVGGGRAALATDLSTGPGTETLVWRGRLRRGNGTWGRAGDGRMLIEVEATDAATNHTTATRSVVVDTRAPTVRANRVTPEPWTGRGLLTQQFSLADPSRPLRVWTRVLQDGRVIDQTPPRRRPANTHSIGWHPDRRGRILPIGLYQAEVVVRDAAGNIRRSTLVPFRVHRSVTTRILRQIHGAGRRVAITIDDCTDRHAWSSMLRTLDRMNAGATFFCDSRYVRGYADLARRTVATDRVSIGSHASDHVDLRTVGYTGTLYRLLGDEATWWDVARSTPAPWFRPPYGGYNSTVLAAAGRVSYAYTVLWDVDPRDWEVGDAGTVISRVLSGAKGGSIILLHTRSHSARALPTIIAGLRARGLRPVGLPEMMG